MIKKTIVIIAPLLIICLIADSQTNQKSDSIIPYERARYLKGDPNRFIRDNTAYPKEGITNKIEGDVVVSFIIKKNGTLDSLVKVSSPDVSLSVNSIVVANSIDKEGWSPTKINNLPIDKKYYMVFRYRIFLNSRPYDYKGKAQEFFENQKYEKALKLYDKWIKDNQYNFESFESRSKVKAILGDMEGAKKDQLISLRLKDEMMSVVNVYVYGISSVERRSAQVQKVQY